MRKASAISAAPKPLPIRRNTSSSRSERCENRIARRPAADHCAHHAVAKLVADDNPAFKHAPDSFEKLRGIAVFHDIAPGTRLERAFPVQTFVMHRNHQNGGFRVFILDDANQIKPALSLQRNIDDREIRLALDQPIRSPRRWLPPRPRTQGAIPALPGQPLRGGKTG